MDPSRRAPRTPSKSAHPVTRPKPNDRNSRGTSTVSWQPSSAAAAAASAAEDDSWDREKDRLKRTWSVHRSPEEMEMSDDSDEEHGDEDASDDDLDVLGIITEVMAFLHEVAEQYPSLSRDALAAAKDLEEVQSELQ